MASPRLRFRRFLRASVCGLLLSSGCQSPDGLLSGRHREDRDLARSRQEVLDAVQASKKPAAKPAVAQSNVSVDEHIRLGQADLNSYNKVKQRTLISDARGHFEEGLRQAPGNTKALHGMAIVSDLEGNYPEAEKFYLRALSQAPSDSEILGNLGYSYLLQNRLAEAEQFCQRAIQADNTNSFAIHHLGDVYARQGKSEMARSTYLRIMPADKADLELSVARSKSAAEKPVAGAPKPSLMDRLIPGPSPSEKLMQDLAQGKADLEKQRAAEAPAHVQAAMARNVMPQDQRGQNLKDQLAAIDKEQYHGAANGPIMIDGQSGQAVRIPGSDWNQGQFPAAGGLQGQVAQLPQGQLPPGQLPQGQQPSMRVEANAPLTAGLQQPVQPGPYAAPAANVPQEYHQAQRLQNYLQAGNERPQDGRQMAVLGEAPQRMPNAAAIPGYAPDAGQARPAAYGSIGQSQMDYVQQAYLQNQNQSQNQNPNVANQPVQPYRGNSPYFEQTGAPQGLQGQGQGLAQGQNPGQGPGPQSYGVGYGPAQGINPYVRQLPQGQHAALPPGLNAALNAAGPQPGQNQQMPQQQNPQQQFANGQQPMQGPANGDPMQDASRAAARAAMGLGASDMYTSGAPVSQFPGQGSLGQNNPVPQPDRQLPINMTPPDLSQSYNQRPQALGAPAFTQGGQQPAPNLQLNAQDQYGARARYDERTLQSNGVPAAMFTNPDMQQYELQRWQAGQQYNRAVENVWNQGPVNSPLSPAAGSVYTYPNQIGQAPGFTPNVQQPYSNQFPGQFPGAPNQAPQGSISHTPQPVQSNASYNSPPANPNAQQGYQQPNGAGQGPAANGGPAAAGQVNQPGGARQYDPNVIVPQPYNAANRAAGNANNANGAGYPNGGGQNQPGLPMIRPAPR